MDTTPAEARDFLKKLATDDKFRQRVQDDPRSVLAEYHITIKDSRLPRKPVLLPPKERVQELLNRIEELDESFLPLGYGWMVMVLAFAMPLVSGDAPEADASG